MDALEARSNEILHKLEIGNFFGEIQPDDPLSFSATATGKQ